MVIAVSHYDLAPKKKYVFHSTKDDVASSIKPFSHFLIVCCQDEVASSKQFDRKAIILR